MLGEPSATLLHLFGLIYLLTFAGLSHSAVFEHKYVRSTLGLLLLTDRATTSAPTIRLSNVYTWSVNKNI